MYYTVRNLKLQINRSPNREIITIRSIYSLFDCKYGYNSNISNVLCSNYTSKAKPPRTLNPSKILEGSDPLTKNNDEPSKVFNWRTSDRFKIKNSNKYRDDFTGKSFEKPSYRRRITASEQSNQLRATTSSNVRQNPKPSNKKLSQTDVDNYFEEHLNQFNKDDVLQIFKAAATKRNNIFIDKHLNKINEFLANTSKTSSYKVSDICIFISSLTKTKTLTPDVENFLSQVNDLFKNSTNDFNLQNLVQALYGLQNLSSEHTQVKCLLQNLIPIFESCTELLTAQNIAMCMYSLKYMNDDNPEVLRLLNVLKIKIASSPSQGSLHTLTSQGYAMSINGFQNMKKNSKQMMELITVLIPKLESCIEPLSGQNIVICLQGLKNMNDTNPEVLQLLKILTSKISSSPLKGTSYTLTSQQIEMLIQGLQSMANKSAELMELIKVLIPRIEDSNLSLLNKHLI